MASKNNENVLTEDELFKLLLAQRQLDEEEDNGFMTMREIAKAMGWSVNMTQIRMRELFDTGRIEVRKVSRMSMVGNRTTVPAYRVQE